MSRFAANLTLLFQDLPYLDRFEAAAAAGFAGIEILYPYDWPGQETRQALEAHELAMVLLNAPPPGYTGAAPGYAAIPDGVARFEKDIRRALRYADFLNAGIVHVMSGVAEGPRARQTLIRNLQWAADLAPAQRFTIEPLNGEDRPGYFLNDYDLAAGVIEAVARPNVGLQFDTYHAQKIHGDACAVWAAHGPAVFHVQIGDVPGRCAPLTGEIAFADLFAAIGSSGYDGWISAEYLPAGPTEKTLGWLHALS